MRQLQRHAPRGKSYPTKEQSVGRAPPLSNWPKFMMGAELRAIQPGESRRKGLECRRFQALAEAPPWQVAVRPRVHGSRVTRRTWHRFGPACERRRRVAPTCAQLAAQKMWSN